MSLWQITVSAFLAAIAALMGAVLVYVRLLTNRIGSTHATLKRLEEALLTTDIPKEEVPPTAAEATQSPQPEASVPVADGGVSYLTVRDLKEISRGGGPAGENAVAMFPVSREALDTGCEPSEEPVAATSDSRGDPAPSGELQDSPGNATVDAELVERRKRDAELILGAQRRRRRARGY